MQILRKGRLELMRTARKMNAIVRNVIAKSMVCDVSSVVLGTTLSDATHDQYQCCVHKHSKSFQKVLL